jgi:hypothetical protein
MREERVDDPFLGPEWVGRSVSGLLSPELWTSNLNWCSSSLELILSTAHLLCVLKWDIDVGWSTVPSLHPNFLTCSMKNLQVILKNFISATCILSPSCYLVNQFHYKKLS